MFSQSFGATGPCGIDMQTAEELHFEVIVSSLCAVRFHEM